MNLQKLQELLNNAFTNEASLPQVKRHVGKMEVLFQELNEMLSDDFAAPVRKKPGHKTGASTAESGTAPSAGTGRKAGCPKQAAQPTE